MPKVSNSKRHFPLRSHIVEMKAATMVYQWPQTCAPCTSAGRTFLIKVIYCEKFLALLRRQCFFNSEFILNMQAYKTPEGCCLNPIHARNRTSTHDLWPPCRLFWRLALHGFQQILASMHLPYWRRHVFIQVHKKTQQKRKTPKCINLERINGGLYVKQSNLIV